MRFLKSQQRAAAATFGVIFLLLLLALAVAVPRPTAFQYTVFRIVLSLSAGGIAAMIPGFLAVEVGKAIRAGGAVGVFVVVYFFSPARLLVEQGEASDSKLSIVDITLAKNPNPQQSYFPMLDVKVRNGGDKTAFLKRARIDILDRIQFTDCESYSAQPVTWTYDMSLDDPKPFEISQSVPPRGVDRFGFVLGHSLEGASEHAFYKLTLTLEYDEDSKQLVSKPFVVQLSGMARKVASTSGPKECYEALHRTLDPARSWPVAYGLPRYFRK
jgi:hypothetical protein